jgi:hypothetical protein
MMWANYRFKAPVFPDRCHEPLCSTKPFFIGSPSKFTGTALGVREEVNAK